MTNAEIRLNALFEVKEMSKKIGAGEHHFLKLEELIADAKREVRAERKEEDTETIVKVDDDSIIYKIRFVDNTKEEIENYFHKNCEREYVPRAYDCTGQVFTAWYKIFNINNQSLLYWGNCIDC